MRSSRGAWWEMRPRRGTVQLGPLEGIEVIDANPARRRAAGSRNSSRPEHRTLDVVAIS